METGSYVLSEGEDGVYQDSGDDLSTHSGANLPIPFSQGDRTHCLNCDMTNKANKCNFNDGENSPCNGCQRIPGERKRPLPCHSVTNGYAQARINESIDSRDVQYGCTGLKDQDNGPRAATQDNGRAGNCNVLLPPRGFKGTYAARLLTQRHRESPGEQEAARQRGTDRKKQVGELKESRKRARSPNDSDTSPPPARRTRRMPPVAGDTVTATKASWHQAPQYEEYHDRCRIPLTSIYSALLSDGYPVSTSQGHLSSSHTVDLHHESDSPMDRFRPGPLGYPSLPPRPRNGGSLCNDTDESLVVGMRNKGWAWDDIVPVPSTPRNGKAMQKRLAAGNAREYCAEDLARCVPWTLADEDILVSMRTEGSSWDAIAQHLSYPRTKNAVKQHFQVVNARTSSAKMLSTTASNTTADLITNAGGALTLPDVDIGVWSLDYRDRPGSEHAPTSPFICAISASQSVLTDLPSPDR